MLQNIKTINSNQMTRLVNLSIFIPVLLLILESCSPVQKNLSPNIVFILADDLGAMQVGFNGNTFYNTPNIDKLAKEGMQFTNAYAACPVCSPTRASIFTGKYPARLHLTDFIAGNNRNDYPLLQPSWQKWLPLEEITCAEVFKEKGYRNAIFGKQGVNETFVTSKPSGNRVQSGQDAENDAHNVDTITRLAVDFIDRNKNHPFFLFVSHNTIHDPLKEKAASIQKYRDLPEADKPENHPVIAAMIERRDIFCGAILDKLTELELNEKTRVIFFSDNGGKYSYAAQTPFGAGKGWLYEGGIREPLLVKWEGKITPGSISSSLVSSVDFFPTFLELLQDTNIPENIDGKSFLPALKNPDAMVHENLFWHYPHYHQGSGMKPAGAVRSGKYKLVEWFEQSLTSEKNAIELYDLDYDMGETTNLADSLPEKAKELSALLEKWREEVGAQMPTINEKAIW